MISRDVLAKQLDSVLVRTDFDFLGEKYEGKVRDNYVKGDIRYLIATDRISCFDVVVSSIPFKGQVLTQIAEHWFKISDGIIENHVIDVPDPNVTVVKNCQVLPVEVVIRNYLTGSAWRDYQSGKSISGVVLPPNLSNY